MMIPRAMRISLRGMPAPMRAVYFGVAGLAMVVMLVALWAELFLDVR